jgi:hypothetical protein
MVSSRTTERNRGMIQGVFCENYSPDRNERARANCILRFSFHVSPVRSDQHLQDKNIEKQYSHLHSRDSGNDANGHEGSEQKDKSGDFGVHGVSEGRQLVDLEKCIELAPIYIYA